MWPSLPLKEEENLVESLHVDINTGEYGSLMILEACCSKINLNLVEEKINFILKKIIELEEFTKEELIKAKRIVKSNYYTKLTNFENVFIKTEFSCRGLDSSYRVISKWFSKVLRKLFSVGNSPGWNVTAGKG